MVVILKSTGANNLKTILKNLIRDATSQTSQSNGSAEDSDHLDKVRSTSHLIRQLMSANRAQRTTRLSITICEYFKCTSKDMVYLELW